MSRSRGVATRPVSRRTTVLGAASLPLLAAACEAEPGAAPASPSSATTPSTMTPTVPADPDEQLVTEVRTAVAAAELLALKTGRAHRPLRGPAHRLRALHRAHQEVFADLAPVPAPTPPQVPADTPRARARLVETEQDLAELLAGSALAADSGPLARVLASMAAGVDQALRGLG